MSRGNRLKNKGNTPLIRINSLSDALGVEILVRVYSDSDNRAVQLIPIGQMRSRSEGQSDICAKFPLNRLPVLESGRIRQRSCRSTQSVNGCSYALITVQELSTQ